MVSMQAANAAACEMALQHVRDCVRACLPRYSGYECQELVGEFMLAFSDAWAAVLFGLKARAPLSVVMQASRACADTPGPSDGCDAVCITLIASGNRPRPACLHRCSRTC